MIYSKIYDYIFNIEKCYFLGVLYFEGTYSESGFFKVKFPRNSYMGRLDDNERLRLLRFEAKQELFFRHNFDINKIKKEIKETWDIYKKLKLDWKKKLLDGMIKI